LEQDEETEEESRLLLRLQQGDKAALGMLFSMHRKRLRRLVDFRLDTRLRGRVDPSDVLQDSFMDASQRLPHFVQGPSLPFFVWLRQVAIQRLVEVHRRHLGAEKRSANRERRVQASMTSSVTSASLAFQLVCRLASPSDVLVRNELTGQLHKALESMDPIDREVLALRHFEELSNDETAAALGLQKSAASSTELSQAVAAANCPAHSGPYDSPPQSDRPASRGVRQPPSPRRTANH
jgi:RNA polymerase sigma-70 factor (ECF subfamily)